MKSGVTRKRSQNFESEDKNSSNLTSNIADVNYDASDCGNKDFKRLKTEHQTEFQELDSALNSENLAEPEAWKLAGEKAGQTTLIVDKILSYCGISTLKNARLVSKTWKNSASRLIRHREKTVVRFYVKSFDYLLSVLENSDDFPCTHFSFPIDGVKRVQLEKFVQIFGPQIKALTIRYYKQSSENCLYIRSMIERPLYIHNWDTYENEPRIHGVPLAGILEKNFENIVWFLENVKNVETLHISNCAWSKFLVNGNNSDFDQSSSSISLPRLRHLNFQTVPSHFFPHDLRQTIGYRILKGAPNLQSIENIPLCRALEDQIMEKAPLIKTMHIDLLVRVPLLDLRHMIPTLHSFVQGNSPQPRGPATALKKLKSSGFFFQDEISPAQKFEFFTLLQSSRDSLEHLELSESISLLDPNFPPLPHLKYLRIREALISCFLYKYFDQSYLKDHAEGRELREKFPQLKTVCLEGSNLEKDSEYAALPPNFKNSVDSVECLEFDGATEVYNYNDFGRIFWTPLWLKRLGQLFPNVKKIITKNMTPLLLIFFLRDLNRIKWPLLEELEIGNVPRLKGKPKKDHVNLDMFFTGLSPDICRQLELESEDKVPGIEKLDELTSGPVFDFSGLKKLHIVFNNSGWYSKHDTFLSKVSLFYGFMRFPNLKVEIHYDQNDDGTGKRKLREKKLKPFAPFVQFSHRPAISDPFY